NQRSTSVYFICIVSSSSYPSSRATRRYGSTIDDHTSRLFIPFKKNGQPFGCPRYDPLGPSLSLTGLMLHAEDFSERSCGQRLAEEETLHFGAAAIQQIRQLLLGLNALGHDAHVEAFCHGDHCLNDRRVVVAANHILHEHRSDLDGVDRHLLE